MNKTLNAFIFLAFLGQIALSPCSLSNEKTITIGLERDVPLFSFYENGVLRGIAPDLLGMLFERLGLNVEFRLLPATRLTRELLAGRTDISILNVRNGIKADKINLSDIHAQRVPFAITDNKLFALESRNIRIESVEDARNYKLGSLRGVPTGIALNINGSAIVTYYNSDESMYKSLLAGRIDLMIGNTFMVESLRREVHSKAQVEPVFKLGEDEVFLIFSRFSFGDKAEDLSERLLMEFKACLVESCANWIYDAYHVSPSEIVLLP